jgi:hypothetical protein
MRKQTGNAATNGRGAFKDHQADGVKNYSETSWGPFKPQQVSPRAFKPGQDGARGFAKGSNRSQGGDGFGGRPDWK